MFVLGAVVLDPLGQGQRVGDLAWEQLLVGQRAEPALT